MDSTTRLLPGRDCEACGAPVIDVPADTMIPRQAPTRFCNTTCGAWARAHPGQRRERPPCRTCGDAISWGWSIEGRWCSMRCRTIDLAPRHDEPDPDVAWMRGRVPRRRP